MSIYIVSINSKYFNNILRYNIKIKKIKKDKEKYLLYLDLENYQKILKFKKIFKIELVDLKGFVKYKNIFKNNIIFFVIFLLAIMYIIFLSNLIFDIKIKTTNKEIEELVREELKKYNINLYKFVKTYDEKEKIKNKILNANKDKLEWLEITRHGSIYNINAIERVIKTIDNDKTPQDIVALKNAIILKIEAKSGSIVKKLNDYVKKGEVIVTGNITHKDEVVNKIKADAIIYGETWYKVHISYPVFYYEKTYTGNKTKRLNFQFLNKNFKIGKQYKNEEIVETKLLYNKHLPIKFSLENIKEVVIVDDLYTVEEAYEEALKMAYNKLLKELPSDSKILNQKKLKLIVNNSTIDVDIFFKVYENITDIKRIEE